MCITFLYNTRPCSKICHFYQKTNGHFHIWGNYNQLKRELFFFFSRHSNYYFFFNSVHGKDIEIWILPAACIIERNRISNYGSGRFPVFSFSKKKEEKTSTEQWLPCGSETKEGDFTSFIYLSAYGLPNLGCWYFDSLGVLWFIIFAL